MQIKPKRKAIKGMLLGDTLKLIHKDTILILVYIHTYIRTYTLDGFKHTYIHTYIHS